MSTTNTQGEPLLGFFEIAVSRDYVIGAWAEFREGSEGWDDISFDPESGSVVAVGMSEDQGLSFHELTFFDWFSRRVRHESNVFLARFGDALASAESSHAAAKLLADVDDHIGRLKKESLRMGEETAHRVFTTWLTRIKQDAEDIASDDQSRRDSRGATPLASLADQDEIVRLVAEAVAQPECWHERSRQATWPNVSAIVRWVSLRSQLLLDLDDKTARARVDRALMHIATRHGLDRPEP